MGTRGRAGEDQPTQTGAGAETTTTTDETRDERARRRASRAKPRLETVEEAAEAEAAEAAEAVEAVEAAEEEANAREATLASRVAEAKRRTLWIGDLAYWMDEQYVLYAFSSVYKTVNHVKLIRNRQTGLHEGYGFVEFATREDADFALKTFPGHAMPGTMHAYVLNWAQAKTPRSSEDGGSAPSTPKKLANEGSSRTVLAPVSESGSDVSEMEGAHDGDDAQEGAEFSVFVGDLGPDVTDAMLTELFKEKCSTAHNARVVVDLKTLRSKGYGFIDFTTEKDYNIAMNEVAGARCGMFDRAIRVCNAIERKPDPGLTGGSREYHDFEDLDPTNTTIFVGNWDANVSEDELRDVFEAFGEVAYVKVTPKKGCGFVHFFSRHEAERALSAIHGTKIGGKTVRLSWGRHNATKCAISSLYSSAHFSQYYVADAAGALYVPTSAPMPMASMGAMIPGMRFPMTSAASVYSMYGGAHVMPPPPPMSLATSPIPPRF